MRKIFLLFLLLMFTGIVFVQTPVAGKTRTKRELAIREIERTLEKSTVLEYLKKCMADITKGEDGKALKRSKYIPYKIRIKTFLDYRWFIADTGLSKKWLSEVYKLLEYMYKTRDVIETAIENHQTQTAKTKQAVKYYNVAYNRFVKLLKKPVKVSAKLKRQSQVKKVMWQRAMRKKYKIKGKIQEDF
jgi:hypothetical protein